MKVGAMLANHAARSPDKVAIVFGDEQVSFAALDRRSNRIANALLTQGLAVGDRVILYVGNSTALVETAAGVWKAGGVVVPVSTWLTATELAFMAGDSRPFAVVYGPEQTAAVEAALEALDGAHRIFIGDDPPPGAETLAALRESGDDAPPPSLAAMPDDALIAYTSGTTGTPKGAITTHANLIVQSLATAAAWGTGGGDVYIVTTPIAHRTGLARLLSCFCLGAEVVVLPRFDGEAAIAAIGRRRVTIFGGVPTVVRLLLDALAPGDSRCDSLRYVLATGEAFPVALKQRLAERLPKTGLFSFYALTEAGSPAALLPHEQSLKPDSVGRPFPGVDIRLVKPDGGEAAVGEEGEICVRCGELGRMVIIRGYHDRPDANAESFDGDWFRTGDVGRFDAGGYLHIVDRVKDMILSAGLNIYSREVEIALESHPDIAEAAVVAGPDAAYGECVVAFVAPRDGAALSPDAVIAHSRETIAGYKKPKHVVVLDRLPRNANGKVIKTELRARAERDLASG